jgi:hypothetical protein
VTLRLIVSPLQAVSVVEASADDGWRNAVGHLTDLTEAFVGLGDRCADITGLAVQSPIPPGPRACRAGSTPIR